MSSAESTTPNIRAGDNGHWRRHFLTAGAHWLASCAAVWLAVAFGTELVPLCKDHPKAARGGLAANMAAWDGQWYAGIASHGYFYDPRRESSVAFFPAFPLLARIVATVARVPVEVALLIVSSVAWLAALVAAGAYLRGRGLDSLVAPTTLVMCWFPTTFYFRMAYSESLFLALTIVTLHGIQRQWPAWRLALIVGLATATRPVGLALLAPLAYDLWRRIGEHRQKWWSVAPTLLLACWGLLCFIAFQAYAFGEPLAFVKTQHWWSATIHRHYAVERLTRLLSLESVRAVYDPATSFYWGLRAPGDCAAFNLMFANPIYFLLTAATIGFGRMKRWITFDETLLGALLLMIPYVLQADRNGLASQARFASVVFPAYIVWGRILACLNGFVGASLGTCSGVLMAIYAILFASWYWFH